MYAYVYVGDIHHHHKMRVHNSTPICERNLWAQWPMAQTMTENKEVKPKK